MGVKAALAEAVTKPTEERVHAAGSLLAEAVMGTAYGLHSRAAAVLGLALREGILRPDDFKSAKVGAGGGGVYVGAGCWSWWWWCCCCCCF